jgi:adenosylcobinamide-GDP ribazoletransferase
VRALLTAFSFLTTIPAPTRADLEPGELGRCTAWFPAIGAVIGIILAGVDWCGRAFWDPYVAGGLVIASNLLLTGGLHIDGLMDTADGFFSRRDREGTLAVMKDSRSGALGVASGITALLLRFAAYGYLGGAHHWRAIVLAPVLGRLGMVLGVAFFPYARTMGTGHGFAEETHAHHAGIAAILALLISFALFRFVGLALCIGAVALALLCALYWLRRLGGLTGDIYGAIDEVTEVAALLACGALLVRYV